jgi:hypothetical protein
MSTNYTPLQILNMFVLEYIAISVEIQAYKATPKTLGVREGVDVARNKQLPSLL